MTMGDVHHPRVLRPASRPNGGCHPCSGDGHVGKITADELVDASRSQRAGAPCRRSRVTTADDPVLSILLLDKAPDYRYRLEAVLAGTEGLDVVHSTRSAESAVDETRRHAPRLVIVDPSGFDDPAALFSSLRAASPGTRIVMLSALSPASVERLQSLADRVLFKGIDGAELVRSLRTLAPA